MSTLAPFSFGMSRKLQSLISEPQLAGWGGAPQPGVERRSEDLEALSAQASLSRGLGRSYGDSSLPANHAPAAANTTLADRILSFNGTTGRLRAEAGLDLRSLRHLLLPRGWFVPVTPGTQFVTLGGMVAADVHGKNHHIDGCIGAHVRGLRMRVASGEIVECSRHQHSDLFAATLGGMGLTGHILEVDLQMHRVPSPWIWQSQRPVRNIDEFLDALSEAAAQWPFTVGWIDCLSRGKHMGRGVLIAGRWATSGEAPAHPPADPWFSPSVPIYAPDWLLGPWSVAAFNTAYYAKARAFAPRGIVGPVPFFYPLDAVGQWNRLYGRRGFTQYQCVLPKGGGANSARRFMDLLTRSGGASFLCVIKDCGPQGEGLLSFPMPGVSVAVDLPLGPRTQALVDQLNAFVIDVGGRIYLAKDSLTRPEHFRAMEPRLDQFEQVRRRWDPQLRFRSAQSVRLFGDPPFADQSAKIHTGAPKRVGR